MWDAERREKPQNVVFLVPNLEKIYKIHGISIRSPSTGIIALLTALELCDLVEIYGFDAGRTKSSRMHYYDDI